MDDKLVILVVDDHPIICKALQLLLEPECYISQVYCAENYDDAVRLYNQIQPDFIILDADLGRSANNGFKLFTTLKKLNFNGYSLCMSANDNPLLSEAALNIGMNGFIDKHQSSTSITSAVKTIMCGYSFFKLHTDRVSLSEREAQIITLLISGVKNKEIALTLNISPKTVSTYKTRILKKYNVNNVIELIKYRNTTR